MQDCHEPLSQMLRVVAFSLEALFENPFEVDLLQLVLARRCDLFQDQVAQWKLFAAFDLLRKERDGMTGKNDIVMVKNQTRISLLIVARFIWSKS